MPFGSISRTILDMSNLQKSIYLTLSYFNLFDYPLSKDELFSWLFKPESVDDFDKQVEELLKKEKIEHRDGFYFLPGRQGTAHTRKERHSISLRKIRKARFIACLLRLVPGLRMIAICSNLGYFNADHNADIDFFIVAKPGKIWTVRFWSTFLMKILGQRPSKKRIKNKICLSYYVTSDNLNLEDTKVGNPDIHLTYLVSQYLPIYDQDNTWQKFCQANVWLNKYLPNFDFDRITKKYCLSPFLLFVKKIVESSVASFEEGFYRKIQKKIMPKSLRTAAQRGDNKVIINDKMLKLHLNDKREEYNRKLKDFYAG